MGRIATCGDPKCVLNGWSGLSELKLQQMWKTTTTCTVVIEIVSCNVVGQKVTVEYIC